MVPVVSVDCLDFQCAIRRRDCATASVLSLSVSALAEPARPLIAPELAVAGASQAAQGRTYSAQSALPPGSDAAATSGALVAPRAQADEGVIARANAQAAVALLESSMRDVSGLVERMRTIESLIGGETSIAQRLARDARMEVRFCLHVHCLCAPLRAKLVYRGHLQLMVLLTTNDILHDPCMMMKCGYACSYCSRTQSTPR